MKRRRSNTRAASLLAELREMGCEVKATASYIGVRSPEWLNPLLLRRLEIHDEQVMEILRREEHEKAIDG